ncbi:MAG: bifunctional YncE family protein/alkaline phosphatase family protein [Rhizomicrobium sp.]
MRLIPAVAVMAAMLCSAAAAADSQLWLPTGQTVTPQAAPGSVFQPLTAELPVVGKRPVGGGATTAFSPDGRTLYVLTAGFNSWRGADGKHIADASTEHLFVYAITDGLKLQQDVHVPNSYGGMVLSPDGKTIYVAGGVDDNVHIYREGAAGAWSESGTPIPLSHASGNGLVRGNAEVLKPMAAGVALTPDGQRLLVANYENDSISVVDIGQGKVVQDLDLRPGKIDPKMSGQAGGEFPYAIAVATNGTAYVSSLRDREIVVLSTDGTLRVTARIKVAGNPNRMILSADGSRLFVAADNSDRVFTIDTKSNVIVAAIAVGAPVGWGLNARLPGAAPNSLALSPDGKWLYVTEGGINAVGVVRLAGAPALVGLIPTAWQPNAVSVSGDGRTLYVTNGKSPAGPNPLNCMRVKHETAECDANHQVHAGNQYVWQITAGGLASIPVPDADTLKRLTAISADNNGFREVASVDEARLMAQLHKRIKHVIYVVRENRTYDQILGDLAGADGDPGLVQFGPTITPNQHALAHEFVALDAFFDSGEASGDGWDWSTAARTTDVTEKEMPVNYADRGLTYDFEGTTRGVNVALGHKARIAANPLNDPDPDLLPGSANQAAPDGPDGEREEGYLWNAVLRAHETIRNYGFFVDLARYEPGIPANVALPLDHDPAAAKLRVAFSTNNELAPFTDPYFRGFDNQYADYWRYREWDREFSHYEKKNSLPRFETIRFMHDHTGDFATAADGVNTPETQVADNDYAVGLLIDRVAHSRFAKDTLIFVIEDDAQDGPDHVDAHRSVAFVAGPYVKHGVVISDRYTTVNFLKTMEVVLGLKPLNFHDANAKPMANIFDLAQVDWTYHARVPDMLRSTALPLPPQQSAAIVKPRHDAAYWAAQTASFDFSAEDRLDAGAYNQLLWAGINGDTPYPSSRDGRNRRLK